MWEWEADSIVWALRAGTVLRTHITDVHTHVGEQGRVALIRWDVLEEACGLMRLLVLLVSNCDFRQITSPLGSSSVKVEHMLEIR